MILNLIEKITVTFIYGLAARQRNIYVDTQINEE